MTEDEIVMNAMIFFGAGYDLTSNTLMFAVYELALHPEIQEKLFEEINNEIGKVRIYCMNGFRFSYSTVLIGIVGKESYN